MTVLRSHVEEAFRHYGTAAKTVNKISRARANEKIIVFMLMGFMLM